MAAKGVDLSDVEQNVPLLEDVDLVWMLTGVLSEMKPAQAKLFGTAKARRQLARYVWAELAERLLPIEVVAHGFAEVLQEDGEPPEETAARRAELEEELRERARALADIRPAPSTGTRLKRAPKVPTKPMVEGLDNEQLLRLFRIVARDITRRIVNYSSVKDAGALLDGIKFAAGAHHIQRELTHGNRSLNGWEYGLFHAEKTLIGCMEHATIEGGEDVA